MPSFAEFSDMKWKKCFRVLIDFHLDTRMRKSSSVRNTVIMFAKMTSFKDLLRVTRGFWLKRVDASEILMAPGVGFEPTWAKGPSDNSTLISGLAIRRHTWLGDPGSRNGNRHSRINNC